MNLFKRNFIIGLVFLVFGILVIAGGITCIIIAAIDFERSDSSSPLFPVGGVSIILGIPCFMISLYTVITSKHLLKTKDEDGDGRIDHGDVRIQKARELGKLEGITDAARKETYEEKVSIYCSHCGAKNSSDDRFCYSCGAQLKNIRNL